MAKDLLLERCLVTVVSRNLQEKSRFCAGGRLRPEGLLIVSTVIILYAGVCLEACERKFRFCVGGRLRPEGLLIVCVL